MGIIHSIFIDELRLGSSVYFLLNGTRKVQADQDYQHGSGTNVGYAHEECLRFNFVPAYEANVQEYHLYWPANNLYVSRR